MRSMLCLFCLLFLAFGTAFAVQPPSEINYQGVLRDAAGSPVDGAHDMVFRFFDAETAGNEIMLDRHTQADSAPVIVDSGLFNVALGSGQLVDGAGPGNYGSMATLFLNNPQVWLSIEVNGELLDPRVKILASAFAVEANHALDSNMLAGHAVSQFLRADAADIAAGSITFNDVPDGNDAMSGPVCINPPSAGAADTLFGIAVNGDEKIRVDGRGTLYTQSGGYGVYGRGESGGGFFTDTNGDSFAYIAQNNRGLYAYGNDHGGEFRDGNGSGIAYVANDDLGIEGGGNQAGAFFYDRDSSGYAYLGYGNLGTRAFGNTAGGFFGDIDNSGFGYVGYGNYGVWGEGSSAGGYFRDIDSTGYAYVGYSNYGARAYGSLTGGLFGDTNSSGYAWVGYGDFGIWTSGNSGAYFREGDTGSYAWLAEGSIGVSGEGESQGGYFRDITSGTYVRTGFGSASTFGNGSKNFVQNHPFRSDQVIVYSAIEGDEAATYTRGSGRLEGGVARITLGETFQWVTNPDIGLTAHLTPRGSHADLYVETLSTTELVVRSESSDSVQFDYVVYGLRLGFENQAVVRAKPYEAYLPSINDRDATLSESPENLRFTALERFKTMPGQATLAKNGSVDMSRGQALVAAIGSYDPERHLTRGNIMAREGAGDDHELESAVAPSNPGDQITTIAASIPRTAPTPAPNDATRQDTEAVSRSIDTADDPRDLYGRSFRSSSAELANLVEVSESVEAGDVLAIDPAHPGALRLAIEAYDPGVVGIVAGEPGLVLGARDADSEAEDALHTVDAPVAVSGVILCKVDAAFGEIRPGDLLTTSSTPGHAMRAGEAAPGTILGKALDAHDLGTGTIRVLVMLR